MDEYTDLFDDGGYTEDVPFWDDFEDNQYESFEDDADDSSGDPSLEDIITDILDGYFASDEEDEEDDEEDGQASDKDAPEDGETADGMEQEDVETVESLPFDPDVLSDIDNTLHRHADDVSGYMSGVTVSGNAVMVSLDGGSAALLRETIDNQNEVLSSMDHMSGIIMLVLFVLLFDLIHRFAKRIIKNFMRGDEKNAANS